MKLSIIVPIYNVENTLKRCVESILTQSFTDYELLLIDDGSPDKSGSIAEELAINDKRIIVYHKSNGGLSDARNYGIKIAKGRYITFIDSDDEITPYTLEHLMQIITDNPKYDILEYPVKEKPGYKDMRILWPGNKEYPNAMEWLSDSGAEHCWACNKIYKRTLFDNVCFPVGKIYEDIYVIVRLLKLKPFIATTNKGMYMYHWNENGIGANATRQGLNPLLEAQIYLVNKLGIDTGEKRWHRLYLNMFTIQLHSYSKTGKISLWTQHVQIKKYNSNSDIIKAIMLNVLGLRLSCIIFKIASRK